LLPITEDLIGDYARDNAYRRHIHKWLHQVWAEKDLRLDEMLPAHGYAEEAYAAPDETASATSVDRACG